MLNVFKICQKSVYLNLGRVVHVKDNDFNLAFEIVEKGFTQTVFRNILYSLKTTY